MKILTSILLWIAIAAFPLRAAAEDIDQTFGIAADATVTVSNVAGEIDISTWNRSEVHLTGSLGTDQELKVTESSSGIQIEVRNQEDDDDWDESFLQLVIPVGASVVAEGVSTDIAIADSRGASITAESVSGDIDVVSKSRRVELSSVSGDVDFDGASDRTAVETVSGDIDVAGISGEITIHTVSGDADLDAGEVGLGGFDTVSGTLDLSLSVSEGGRLTLESMSGDVYLLLPESQSGSFSAQSFSGDISSVVGEVKNESYGPGSHLKHVSGDSGATIRVESFSGDIHIGHK